MRFEDWTAAQRYAGHLSDWQGRRAHARKRMWKDLIARQGQADWLADPARGMTRYERRQAAAQRSRTHR